MQSSYKRKYIYTLQENIENQILNLNYILIFYELISYRQYHKSICFLILYISTHMQLSFLKTSSWLSQIEVMCPSPCVPIGPQIFSTKYCNCLFTYLESWHHPSFPPFTVVSSPPTCPAQYQLQEIQANVYVIANFTSSTWCVNKYSLNHLML